ncbi:hypothetical protein ACFV6E_29360 [Streptomyces sp. NPDC059785]|uniref:hypothetical protein n=1 Tax=unclassified Streptomyces TaxID=2593676 RepID=UPI0036650D15
MQSESAIENRATARGRRRKRGSGPAEGPVFVDNSGRRARLLRRIGMLLGIACIGYAAVLGMAFMGWGTSLTPSSLLPFGGDAAAPGNMQPQGGIAPGGARPSGLPTGAAPSATPSASASASASAN